jgi:hypothetical protein
MPDALIGDLGAVFRLFFGGLFIFLFHAANPILMKLNMQSNFDFQIKLKLMQNLIKYEVISIDISAQQFYLCSPWIEDSSLHHY